jgi:protein SCO1
LRTTGFAAGFAAVLAVAISACGGRESSGSGSVLARDSDFAGPKLASFVLTERSGRTARLEDLAGKPFVLDFVFTTCSTICPVMSGSMSRLQNALADTDVRLVSVTVDPETDTPEVLADYATKFGADAERWWFLTGTEEQIDALVSSVQLAREKDPNAPIGMQVTHSSRLIVVDGQGVVRGYFDGQGEEGVRAAEERARWLATQR